MEWEMSRDEAIIAAYRLSWPAPEVPKRPEKSVQGLLARALSVSRRQVFEGWPVALSAPLGQ